MRFYFLINFKNEIFKITRNNTLFYSTTVAIVSVKYTTTHMLHSKYISWKQLSNYKSMLDTQQK